jgi:hypothetical protein
MQTQQEREEKEYLHFVTGDATKPQSSTNVAIIVK